jgi:hypothetical protein
VLLGFALLSTAAFILGALRILFPPLLGGIIVLLAAAGGWGLARTRRWFLPPMTLAGVPFIASVAFVAAHLPKAVYPVLEHDESTYHLLLPKLYLAAHALIALPWSVYANMPHLVDLAFVFPMALGGFTAAKVFVLGFIGWTLVGLAPFGRSMLGPIGPGVLAVLYLSGRTVQWHLGLAYVEPVIGALLLGALQSLWRYRETGARAELLFLAIVAGAACASKYTVWPYAVVLFAAAALMRPSGGRAGARLVGAMAGICALLVVPWLVKNALATGNPIYPNAHGTFGGTYWSQIQAVQLQHELGYGSGADRGLGAYLKLPIRLVTEPYTGLLGSASFSASVMFLLLVSMAFPWRRAEFFTTLRLLSITALVFWCLGPKQGRFLVAFVPVMIVTAGRVLVPLRRFRAGLASAVVAVTVVALVQILRQPYPTEPSMEVFTHSRDDLLSRNPCWGLAQYLNRVVPAGGRVLSFWENQLYFLDRPFITDSMYGAPTMLAQLREAGDARLFAERCAAEGVTHVVLSPFWYETYMANGFRFDVLDERVYPAEKLSADHELFDRFVNTELELMPWREGVAVFRLKAARIEAGASSARPGRVRGSRG